MTFTKVMLLQVLCAAIFVCVWVSPGFADDQPKIATVDAGIGSCKANFVVKDGAGKPIYNSKISVLIKYGFMNLRQTDLQAYTNVDGQARFTGLPNFSKKPLEFNVSSGTVSKTVTDDPVEKCDAAFDVTLSVH
jgi:outer membrane lipoprotein-sorting protein